MLQGGSLAQLAQTGQDLQEPRNSIPSNANRLLRRSILAEECIKKLPRLLTKLRTLMKHWHTSTDQKFAVGRMKYESDVLPLIEEFYSMHKGMTRKPDAEQSRITGTVPSVSEAQVSLDPPLSAALVAMAATQVGLQMNVCKCHLTR
jgi:hypothetical protein